MFAPASIPTPGHTHDTKLGQSLLCGGDQAEKAGWNSQIVCIIVQYFFKIIYWYLTSPIPQSCQVWAGNDEVHWKETKPLIQKRKE